MTDPTCLRCHQTLGPELPAWLDGHGEGLCVPCAMGLALPDRPAGRDVLAPPRFALPRAVSEAIRADLDLGTGRSWPITIVEFSVGGMRVDAPMTFGVGAPAVVVLRDRTSGVRPAVFAVQVRWQRPGPGGRWTLGTQVVAAVDGHHAAFLSKVLERVAMAGTSR